ncbi:hypothetical protein GGI02_002361 [Coemansia sp. RSA 2322]|nr:hypothetical protein GGI02_002361 [Coemansia sp. RSA 2322]
MDDGTSGARSGAGNAGTPTSPLRIYTRVNSGERDKEEASPQPRGATNALLSSAFSRPYEDEDCGSTSGRPAAVAAVRAGLKADKGVGRVGRHGAQYHPLPSHWREHDSGSSGIGSPITPEGGGGGGGDELGVARTVGPTMGLAAYGGLMSMQGGEVPRSYLSPRDYYQVKTKTVGPSPVSSPRLYVGALREAFGSASSLEWANDRPTSTYSCQSTDQAGAGHLSEIQAESPLDVPAHGGRFPPALSSMAARPGAGRSGLGAFVSGGSRHHASASTSSSHYSFGVSSPPERNAGPEAAQLPGSKQTGTGPAQSAGGEASGVQGEDIVRKYFGLQRRAVSAATGNGGADAGSEQAADSRLKVQQHPYRQRRLSSTPALTPSPPQSQALLTGAPLVFSAGSSLSPDDEALGSIVFRRAVSSGDLPTLDGQGGGTHGGDGGGSGSGTVDSRSFLTPDLVESPLEALVRRLTIELFQLYVSEDRKKVGGAAQRQQEQQGRGSSGSANINQFPEEDEFVIVGGRLQAGGTAATAAATTGQATPGDGFIQQFRLGPSLRSGSTTPAVTMDGYFDPQATSSGGGSGNSIGTGNDNGSNAGGPVRVRPRHRLVQRTWMEEALIKARRVSTIDENAEEAILQGLGQEGRAGAQSDGATAAADGVGGPAQSASGTPSPLGGEEVAQFAAAPRVAQRGVHRARDPAAAHRKLAGSGRAAGGMSAARASLLRAVGRRQSVRLQPGKGRIVVAETHVGARDSIAAEARAKRANSLPGLMQVPETREVSYGEQQRRAARSVAMEKAALPRGRVVRRAERMVLGGSVPASRRGEGVGAGKGDGSRHTHRRGGSRGDMETQLVRVELPPPVPLRVRREPVRVVAEPLIIVRRAAEAAAGRDAGESAHTAEARMQRIHNQLLGAQAVLSRHNSVMRQAAAPGVQKAARKQALGAVMLDNALEDRMGDGERQRVAAAEPSRPWRAARRRSNVPPRSVQKADQPADQQADQRVQQLPQTNPAHPQARRLLLHGPAYRIYSGIRARPDTYLFLFSDLLVVTTRVAAASAQGFETLELGSSGDALEKGTSAAVMAPPSGDANVIPGDSRFRVHIVIPLARGGTTLKTTREGASKRSGEDGDGEERRLSRQEERIRRACVAFEKNASEAVVYLINREIIEAAPDAVAGFLFRCTALSRRQIGNFLGAGILGENLHENATSDEVEQERTFHRQIWAAFLDRCRLAGVALDEALRVVLFYVRLPNSPASISALLELAALQWFGKNSDGSARAGGVFVPESADLAVKLAFAIMTLNTELHNPLLRADAHPDAAFRDLVLKFRASVVDDPAVAARRKGNVLRKRDQPRVVTVMEVPPAELRAVFDRVAANRLVTCSDARPAAAEFDVEWIRDAADAASAAALSDEQVAAEVGDVYCDPGFRAGALFNATSDRLPAKLSVDPPAWLRVTVRIPAPDAKLAICVRASSVPADASAAPPDVVAIQPAARLTFRAAASAVFVIRPLAVGHVTLHFVSEGAHARYYHPIPSRALVVEGVFMRHTLQLAWRPDAAAAHRARHMFGMDSLPTKARWVRCIDAALAAADTPPADAQRCAERATHALAALAAAVPDHPGITGLQLLSALSAL